MSATRLSFVRLTHFIYKTDDGLRQGLFSTRSCGQDSWILPTSFLHLDQSLPLADRSAESFDIYFEDRYKYLCKRSCILSSNGFSEQNHLRWALGTCWKTTL